MLNLTDGTSFHDDIIKGIPFPADCFDRFDYSESLNLLESGISLVESADSLYKGECEAYKDALNVLRWNCGYPLPEDVLSGNVRYGLSEKIEKNIENEILESIEIAIKYKGYIDREQKIADKIMRLENLVIPDGFDFDKVESLSIECRQKLKKYAPKTIAQASRISGVSPADISVLLVYFGR